MMGAIVAYLIGSGFATGQEGLQYFASFGAAGAAGALVITLLLYCYVTAIVLRDGRNLRLQSGNKIFEYYCGKYIGKFFGIFAPLFFFCLYAVMLAGAGATLNEQFGWSGQIGILGMAAAVLLTAMLGLDGLVAILSKVAPLIVAVCIAVGISGIVRNPQGVAESADTLAALDVLQAAPHWALSGLNFPALGILMLVPFLASLGRKVRNDAEAVAGGLAGAITLVVSVAVVAFGLLANIGEVHDNQIPMLWIAGQLFTGAGGIYSAVLFAGIYTTAVPLLWSVVNRVETNDKSKRAKVLALSATVVAVLLAQVPFAELVNFLYPVAGYLALVLLACIAVRHVRNVRNRRRGNDVYAVEFERVPEKETAAGAVAT